MVIVMNDFHYYRRCYTFIFTAIVYTVFFCHIIYFVTSNFAVSFISNFFIMILALRSLPTHFDSYIVCFFDIFFTEMNNS